VAVLNGGAERALTLDLSFLKGARFDALVVRDRMDDAAAVQVEKTTAKPGALSVTMRAGGGFIARLTTGD
jgi:hypothetical protein